VIIKIGYKKQLALRLAKLADANEKMWARSKGGRASELLAGRSEVVSG
jgi:hypothetical protein